MLWQTPAPDHDTSLRNRDHPAHPQRPVDKGRNCQRPRTLATAIKRGDPPVEAAQTYPAEREDRALIVALDIIRWMKASGYRHSEIAELCGITCARNEDDLIWGLALQLYWETA